jgi:hypothetical protein
MLYQLSYSRLCSLYVSLLRVKQWWGKDSNLRRLSRQIYSLVPLTARVPHHLIQSSGWYPEAGEGTRTRNLLFTKQLLCQLSYTSTHALLQLFKDRLSTGR